MCQLGNEMLKVHAGLLEGPARGCQSPRAEIKVGQTRAAARQIEECHCNDCTAAAAISHCPSSRRPPLSPTPSHHIHLLLSRCKEITISMIMTQTNLLKLITGHNTSFSVLIRKLIGNRLVCFPRSTFLPPHCGLVETDRRGDISSVGMKPNTQTTAWFMYSASRLAFFWMRSRC